MAKESWYPNFELAVPYTVKEAFRRLLDFIYELRDQLGPLTIWARGADISQTIDVAPVAVNGCSVTLPRTGNWLVTGCFTILVADSAQLFTGSLRRTGDIPQQYANLEAASGTTATVCQQWLIAAQRNETVSLVIQKEGGGGTSEVLGTQSTISATWAGN